MKKAKKKAKVKRVVRRAPAKRGRPKAASRKKSMAPRRVNMQKLREQHDTKLQQLRQQEANHFHQMLMQADSVIRDNLNPEDVAAAQVLHNDMQAELLRIKRDYDVVPS